MIDRDVILEKVNSIQNCLQRIHNTVGNDTGRLEDIDVQDIVVLNIQRAVQLTIDIAFHILSEKNWGLPKTLKDAFYLLQKNGAISSDLEKRLAKMVGFRNIAVHDYRMIDSNILGSIVTKHLTDLEEFISVILKL